MESNYRREWMRLYVSKADLRLFTNLGGVLHLVQEAHHLTSIREGSNRCVSFIRNEVVS